MINLLLIRKVCEKNFLTAFASHGAGGIRKTPQAPSLPRSRRGEMAEVDWHDKYRRVLDDNNALKRQCNDQEATIRRYANPARAAERRDRRPDRRPAGSMLTPAPRPAQPRIAQDEHAAGPDQESAGGEQPRRHARSEAGAPEPGE